MNRLTVNKVTFKNGVLTVKSCTDKKNFFFMFDSTNHKIYSTFDREKEDEEAAYAKLLEVLHLVAPIIFLGEEIDKIEVSY